MRGNVVSEASISTHISQWWQSLPLATALLFSLCLAIFLVDVLVGFDSFGLVCFSPTLTALHLQIFRAFTAPLFHLSLLHIALNLATFCPISSGLERLLGSSRLLHLLLLLLPLSNAALHGLVALLPAALFGWWGLAEQCAVGLSGVIFSLLVIETHVGGMPSRRGRSIFGLVTVPSKWYPWVLLLLFQLLLPSVSLLGHLAGIISGILYCRGFFNLVTPSSTLCSSLESSSFLARLTSRSSFIAGGTPISAFAGMPTFVETSSSALLSSLRSRWQATFSAAPVASQSSQSSESSSQATLNQPSLLSILSQPFQSAQPTQPLSSSSSSSSSSFLSSPLLTPLNQHQSSLWPPLAAGAGGWGAAGSVSDGAVDLAGGKVEEDKRFPGRGRTLRDSAVPQSEIAVADASLEVASTANSTAAAAAAAMLRAAASGNKAVVLKSTNGSSTVAARRDHSSYTSVPATDNANQAPKPPTLPSAVDQLVAMGFSQVAAEAALEASNGDIGLAIEFLGPNTTS